MLRKQIKLTCKSFISSSDKGVAKILQTMAKILQLTVYSYTFWMIGSCPLIFK